MATISRALDFSTAAEVWEDTVDEALQNKRQIKGAFSLTTGNTGQTYHVNLGDSVEMEEASFQPLDIDGKQLFASDLQVSIKNYNRKLIFSKAFETLFTYDMIQYNARQLTFAGDRMQDYALWIQPIFENNGGLGRFDSLAKSVGTNTGMNVEKLVQAADQLINKGVDERLHLIAPMLQKSAFFDDPKFSNSDFSGMTPFKGYQVSQYSNVMIHWVSDAGINKLPNRSGSGTTGDPWQQNAILCSEDAVHQVYNRMFQTNLTDVERQDRWEALGTFTAGARVTRDDRVFNIECEYPFS